MTYPFAPRLVFQQEPCNFTPKVEVSACFINVNARYLFLKRHPSKIEGGTWGIPGGKIEKGESSLEGVIREVKEETTIDLCLYPVRHLSTVFIRYPKVDFTYHMFETKLEELPSKVVISEEEHSDYVWIYLHEALALPLIPGEDECIFLSYGIKSKEKLLNSSLT